MDFDQFAGSPDFSPDFLVNDEPEVIVQDFEQPQQPFQEPTTSIDVEAQFRRARRKASKGKKKVAKKSKAKKAKKSKAKKKTAPRVCRNKKGRFMKCRKGQRRAV